MNENYSPWGLNIDSYFKLKNQIEKNRFLVNFALLAPSSHNTQPWWFKVDNDSIKVFRNLGRRLPVADSNDRQHYLSIGCCIENIVIAADYYGYDTKVVYRDKTKKEEHVATIFLTYTGSVLRSKDHLIYNILLRKTNRGKYNPAPLPLELIKDLSTLSNVGSRLSIINVPSKIEELADITVAASVASMESREFRYELSHHLKHNLTKEKTGMPGFSLEIPTLISFILPILIRSFNLEKIIRDSNKRLFVKNTPALGIITTHSDKVENWLDAGRMFQHTSLILNAKGISTAPWGAPIQIGDFYKKIQLVIDTSERPQFLFRVGIPLKQSRFSPRFNLADVIK